MPFFGGVANSLSIYKNFHTMVASKAPAKDGTVMGQGPFDMKYFLGLEVRSEPLRVQWNLRVPSLLTPPSASETARTSAAQLGQVAVASRPHVRCPERERGDLRR